jgi:predicted phage terminase large subunit-like protein
LWGRAWLHVAIAAIDIDVGYTVAAPFHRTRTGVPFPWCRRSVPLGRITRVEVRAYASEPPRQTLNIYGGSDYAVTSDGGDYTVHVVIGVDPENRMYLLDLWRGQTSSDIWIEAWCDLVKKWKPSFWAEEHGQIIAGVGPFLERRAVERHAYTHREQFPSRGDKAVRAQSMRGRMAMLGLYVRQGAPWFADLRAELLSFPAGRHDDQVDALGLVGQLLDKINAGQKPKPPDVTQPDGYRTAFEEMPSDSWKTM